MARITPIDVIKGISGKYGSRSNEYFTINSSSNRIHLAKYLNKPTGPATELQVAQMQAFATQQKMAAAWLRANRPSEENGPKGTEAYQEAQALKKLAHLSNVRQIVLKYMDEEGNVNEAFACTFAAAIPSLWTGTKERQLLFSSSTNRLYETNFGKRWRRCLQTFSK